MLNVAMLNYVVRPSDRIAKIYPQKRLVIIDPSFYAIKNFNVRVFVLLHELAHLNTKDEYDADYQAFDMYRDAGYPLRDCIFALSRVLPLPKNYLRVKRLYDRILNEYPELAD